MCIQNLSHFNSVGDNSRNFCVTALSSAYIRKSQEFISGEWILLSNNNFCQSRKE